MATHAQVGVSATEIAKFDALAASWWNPEGPMRELHRMNRLRTSWVGDRIARRQGGRRGLLLDVGCGAGIAAEAFARQGFQVVGLDAANGPIEAARAHAQAAGVTVSYRLGAATELLAEGARFDAITALEVIEHVVDPAAFVGTLAGLLAPGGLLFVSTINRTARSFALAIVGAEYVARIVPRGTHDWRHFVTPAELSAYLRGAGLRLADIAGMVPDFVAGTWRTSRQTAVNYIAMAEASAL